MQTSLKKQILYIAQNCTIYSRNYDICIILRLGVIKPNCLLHIRQLSIKTLTKVISWIKVLNFLTEQFLQGNVPLRHLLDEKTPLMS